MTIEKKKKYEQEDMRNREEEKQLNNYDAFVDASDNSIHEYIDMVMRKYEIGRAHV